jgi:hypothetical protein
MIEIPALFHVNHIRTRAVSAWKSPSIPGIDPLRSRIEVSLIRISGVVTSINRRRRSRLHRMNALHFVDIMEVLDELQHLAWNSIFCWVHIAGGGNGGL